MKVLIFGATGLIGSNLFKYLSTEPGLNVYGTYRNEIFFSKFYEKEQLSLRFFDYEKSNLIQLIDELRPEWVINALGITKHAVDCENVPKMIQINAVFPHQLAQVCNKFSAKFIQISTDCVFSGNKGGYVETDLPDSMDLYGKSKALGEVIYGNNLTLRISTIGRELNSKYGLLEWFLNQKDSCQGYRNAIFSGLPTRYLGEVIKKHIFVRMDLEGLFHVSSIPIDKCSLLELLAIFYNKDIKIIENKDIVIDRSLNSNKFLTFTGHQLPSWHELINNNWL